MRTKLYAIVAAIALMFMAAPVQSRATTCPTRPPGYWAGQACTLTTVQIMGAPCLVEICYCYHIHTLIPASDSVDEYWIYSARPLIPGCLTGPIDVNIMQAVREALVKLNARGDLQETTPCNSGTRTVTTSHATLLP